MRAFLEGCGLGAFIYILFSHADSSGVVVGAILGLTAMIILIAISWKEE